MSDGLVQMFNILVEFDVAMVGTGQQPIKLSSGSFTGDKALEVGQGIGIIVLQLVTLNQGNGPAAQFPTYPIEWFTATGGSPVNTPIAQPENFDVHWLNAGQCTIIDINSALVQNGHPFNVVVAYNNQTFGTDPSIVNMPPG
jgi:hypothetical protein